MENGWAVVGFVAWLFLAGLAAGHAIIFKRDPRSSAIWVLLILLLPYAGPWLYWVLGINRLERKVVRILGRRARPFDLRTCEDPSTSAEEIRRSVGHLELLRHVTDRVTPLPLLKGNRLVPLHNGEQAYPDMLAEIRGARRSVTLISYIFDCDDVGYEFADALAEAADRGVHVHVLVDGIGAFGQVARMTRRLRKTRVETVPFFPVRLPFGRLRINLRNHRKILVVDGRTAYTGGMNISARHLVARDTPHRCEDLHFRITGPVVSEIQHTFIEDWHLATGRMLDGQDYLPPQAPMEGAGALCRGIASGPDEDLERIHWYLLAAFAAARSSVDVVTPYFVPTMSLISAMVMASLRGVRVRLFLPSVVDYAFMRWAADAYLWQVLEHGVEVYRRRPPFVHTKLAVVDDLWTLLGSANLDRRSFRLNFEFNVEAYDRDLAHGLTAWLTSLIPNCTRVTLEEVDSRPIPTRLRDGLVKLFSPHL